MNEANRAIEEKRTGRVVPVSEWCRISGYAVSAVEGMIAEGLPLAVRGGPGKPHKLDSAQAIVWLLRRERARARKEALEECGYEEGPGRAGGAEGSESPVRSESLKERMQLAKVKREELELAKAEGALIERETVETILANLVVTARARLLALPSRLAPQIAVETDVAAVRKMLDEGVGEALEELANVEPAELVGEKE